MKSRAVLAIALASLAAGCLSDVDGDSDADGNGDDGEGVTTDAVSPRTINVGFNGEADQFSYMAEFWAKATIHPGPRLCHGYFQWNLADSATARAPLDTWLAAAQAGGCQEALIALKSETAGSPPSVSAYATAVKKIVDTDWATTAGFTGALSFTAWNEPNNSDPAGDGLGVAIPARTAADYYMELAAAAAASPACKSHGGCKVAAGDFASNGDLWTGFSWNCANDNVAEGELCKQFSSENGAHAAASYLDLYKNEIAQHATDHGLAKGFRPAYFAFHGWHDSNGYLYNGDTTCAAYGDCAVRRMLKSLGGSWADFPLWDTEDGMGQKGALTDPEQACGAAFLLRLQSVTDRVQRIYVTRMHGGTTELETGPNAPRAAFDVLLDRETSYPGC